jgi:hypothetical protein
MSRIMKTLAREVRVGDFHNREDEYLIRLWSDVRDDNGQRMWVDFAIYEVIGCESGGKRRKFYNRKDSVTSPNPVYDPEEAESAVEGFVKWDGCTQFTADIHVDCKRHLDALLEMIGLAREGAAEIMGSAWDAKDEYG